MSSNEFAGQLRNPVQDAQGQIFWTMVRAYGQGDATTGDVVRAASLWRVTARTPARVAPGACLLWGHRSLMVLRIEEDPLTPDRISYVCEERV